MPRQFFERLKGMEMSREDFFDICKFVAGVGLIVFGVYSCHDSEAFAEYQKKEAAQKLYRETPRPFKQVDGCTVYEFERDQHTHYFTRCPSTTTTETNRTQSCGKNCTKRVSETIVTENQ